MKSIKAYTNSPLELPDDAVILCLSPFPPDGEWGGAIRSREITKVIMDMYPRSKTLHVNQLPVHIKELPEFLKQEHSQLDDILMLFKDFSTEKYLDAIPDAIIFDHPWLWEEAKKLKQMFPNVKLIHSSHNIECALKGKLLEGLEDKYILQAVDYVKGVEKDIAMNADLVICVTEVDAMWFQTNGANQIVVANNGTNTTPMSHKTNKQYGLVVGSAHPPNIEGSIQYLTDAPDWMIPGSNLIYVGSLSDALKGRIGRQISLVKESEVFLLGIRSNEDLQKLIESASVIILPVPYGGGSNLKTAEALLSGRPVVGTKKSFRGFEEHIGSRNVVVADDLWDFRDAINKFLENKQNTVLRYGVDKLLWKNTLLPIRKYLEG